MQIDQKTLNETLRRVFLRRHHPAEIILTCVRWYVAYPLSLRQIEEMRAERGVEVDHATIHRWAIKMLPVLVTVCRRRKRPVGKSWRMDETYIKVAGQSKYLYRALDKSGATVDFLLRAKRDHAAAGAFFERAIGLHDVAEKVAVDKNESNKAAIVSIQDDTGLAITLRQSKYLNNIVEQDNWQALQLHQERDSRRLFRHGSCSFVRSRIYRRTPPQTGRKQAVALSRENRIFV